MPAQNDGSGTATSYLPIRLLSTQKLKDAIADQLTLDQIGQRLGLELEQSGHQWRGLCPLHDEDSPSFYIAPGKGRNGLWHCFGCGAGGDEIELVREVLHLGFTDALVWLAGQTDIDLAAHTRPPTDDERARDRLTGWCEDWLRGRLPGDERVQDERVLDEFGVGARRAPAGEVPAAMQGKEWWLQGTIFPYRSASGQLLGWKARQPDKKMFGTPQDFPLFRPALFGLPVALAHRAPQKPLVIVEGEYDCLALHEAGIRHAVALGGSAFTPAHADQLVEARVRDVVFWMDGDEAGMKAATAAAKTYWASEQLSVKIASAWPGADPEDVVRSVGVDLVRDTLARAEGALEWLLRQQLLAKPRDTLTAKLDFIEWVRREFGQQLRGLREEAVLRAAAGWIGLSDLEVMDFVKHERGDLFVDSSERAVIGAALRDSNYFLQARKQLAAGDFFMERHQRMWSAIEAVFRDGLEVERGVMLARATAAGVPATYIAELWDADGGNVEWHQAQVVDMASRRAARDSAQLFKERIADLQIPAAQSIGQLTQQVTERALGVGNAFHEIADQVDETMETIQARMRGTGVAGIDLGTQLPTLTAHLNGIQPRKFILVAAASGVGKSTLTLQACAAMAVGQAVPTDFISLEMDYEEIVFKLAAHLTGIDSMQIAKGALDKNEIRAVEGAMLRLRNSPLRIHTPDGISASEFVLYARESVMRRRTEVFVIDYAQMTSPDPEDVRLPRYQQIGNFGYAAKLKVARALDVAVIACAQLRRDAAGKEEPTSEDMGDSYDLVRAADAVLLLSQPVDQGMELWIGKNRMGRGHVLIPMDHDAPAQTFRERGGGALSPDWRVTV